MTKAEQLIANLSDELARIEISLSTLRATLPSLLDHMNEWKRLEQTLRVTRVGRFKLHQRVRWQENRHKTINTGTIIAIVPPRHYPTDPKVVERTPVSMKTLRYRGYYRYEESYLILDDNNILHWPRVNSLIPLKQKR